MNTGYIYVPETMIILIILLIHTSTRLNGRYCIQLCLMGNFINPSYPSSFVPQLKHFLLPLLYVLLTCEGSEAALFVGSCQK